MNNETNTLPEFDQAAAERATERWLRLAKPPGSLGLLEKSVVRIAGLTGDPGYRIDRRLVLVLCADNGVARRGVSLAAPGVTAALARALARGGLAVCKMAGVAGADVAGVDMGLDLEAPPPGLLDRRVARGTGDISRGPAMSREEALRALDYGRGLVRWSREQGYRILATGELGIANTTTASAVAAVLLDKPPALVTGRGTGMSPRGLEVKVGIIEEAIAVNRPRRDDPLDVLAKLGGFDIAGLAGVYLEAARLRLPVLVDGLISSAAALVAKRLCPGAERAMIASHLSAEPAAGSVLDALGLEPPLTAGMRLGEGTGAVAALPLLDMAYAVYDGMATFDELAIGGGET